MVGGSGEIKQPTLFRMPDLTLCVTCFRKWVVNILEYLARGGRRGRYVFCWFDGLVGMLSPEQIQDFEIGFPMEDSATRG